MVRYASPPPKDAHVESTPSPEKTIADRLSITAGDGADSSSCDHSFGLSGTDSQCGTNGFGCCFGIYHIYAYGVYPEYVKVLRGERKKQKTKSGGFDAGHFCVVFFCIYHAGAGACLFWNLFHEGKLLSQKYVIAGNHFSNVFIYQ